MNQIEYLESLDDLENIRSTVVLDGRKVRLGFESDEFEPLKRDSAENTMMIELLDKLKVVDQKSV